MSSKTVFEKPISSLRNVVLDLKDLLTPKNYRFIDCAQFVKSRTLVISEISTFPTFPYSAVSYVWRGNPLSGTVTDSTSSFSVEGAKDGDPVSVDVLTHVCTASLQSGANYVWLDRLCISQTDPEDKAWQITQMYRVYQACHRCFILPGGISRLVGLNEETSWIHRAWTLQEVLAPNYAMVLFAWHAGPGWFYGKSRGDLVEVIEHQSAVVEIDDLLRPYLGGDTFFTTDDDEPDQRIKIDPIIFGRESSHVIALLGAMDARDGPDTDDHAPHAIWRSAMMRTSSRPVDMVFSIMGLFNVILDPRSFDKNDRIGATIALAREILRQGGKPSWLGVSFSIPPSRAISTFPEFPMTRVEGKALIRTDNGTKEIAEVIQDEFLAAWSLREAIEKGSMDEDGYLTFSSKAARIVPGRCPSASTSDTGRIVVKDEDSNDWEILSDEGAANLQSNDPRRFIVYVGMALAHPWASRPMYLEIYSLRAILVEEHKPEKFHRTSNFTLGPCYEAVVKTWKEHDFNVGPVVNTD
ncbi:hypothetical protein K435DRAFT_692492 [Dendrothele bispora CBS 962.96]|uniref:Heterokaryon incompatibility domain-containing protein n=1 Tax=Dendrothele bispora (strain CBS 962.96) TaxID=1314807 RepID=A0A4S8L0P7_DENBC|nr:hypothetical protein K435DRAFT_692492 [Dendrothele bispora CBS 962.96]